MSEVVSWWNVKYSRNAICFHKHQRFPPCRRVRTHSQRRHSCCAAFLQTQDVYKGLSHALAVGRGARKSTLQSRPGPSRPPSADSETNAEAHRRRRWGAASRWGRGSWGCHHLLCSERQENPPPAPGTSLRFLNNTDFIYLEALT